MGRLYIKIFIQTCFGFYAIIWVNCSNLGIDGPHIIKSPGIPRCEHTSIFQVTDDGLENVFEFLLTCVLIFSPHLIDYKCL